MFFKLPYARVTKTECFVVFFLSKTKKRIQTANTDSLSHTHVHACTHTHVCMHAHIHTVGGYNCYIHLKVLLCESYAHLSHWDEYLGRRKLSLKAEFNFSVSKEYNKHCAKMNPEWYSCLKDSYLQVL